MHEYQRATRKRKTEKEKDGGEREIGGEREEERERERERERTCRDWVLSTLFHYAVLAIQSTLIQKHN